MHGLRGRKDVLVEGRLPRLGADLDDLVIEPEAGQFQVEADYSETDQRRRQVLLERRLHEGRRVVEDGFLTEASHEVVRATLFDHKW